MRAASRLADSAFSGFRLAFSVLFLPVLAGLFRLLASFIVVLSKVRSFTIIKGTIGIFHFSPKMTT